MFARSLFVLQAPPNEDVAKTTRTTSKRVLSAYRDVGTQNNVRLDRIHNKNLVLLDHIHSHQDTVVYCLCGRMVGVDALLTVGTVRDTPDCYKM